MNEFESMGLKQEILDAIAELGFEKPMPVQEKVIPIILEGGRDLVALAQTGTGKTAAFGLPLLSLIDPGNRAVQALILCPTRELCLQIAKDLGNFAKHMAGLDVLAVYGGASIQAQLAGLKKGAQIVVATPGRILDVMNRKRIDASTVATLVLDEADEMLNMGFQEDLNAILAQTPEGKRTLLFSATMSREVSSIAQKYLKDPVEVTLGTRNSGSEDVEHLYYMVHASDRYLALKRIADANPDIYGIIFCRTRIETNEVAEKLIADGYSAEALHGELSQQQRDFVMQKFRARTLRMLVATDVAARGLDVNDLTHVINYNLPDDIEVYTHRSGRTGRAGKKGICASIVHARERYRIDTLERMVKRSFERRKVPTGAEICEKQLLHMLDKMEKVEVNEAEIEKFLPAVYAKLEAMPREELIKKFVSAEFNRFLEYYRNTPDLDLPEHREPRPLRPDRPRPPEGSMASFFINVGQIDGMHPQSLLSLINQNTRNRNIIIGKMKILQKCSFFEAEQGFTQEILRAFQKATFEKRRLVVDMADSVGGKPPAYGSRPEGRPEGRSYGPPKEGYKKKRY